MNAFEDQKKQNDQKIQRKKFGMEFKERNVLLTPGIWRKIRMDFEIGCKFSSAWKSLQSVFLDFWAT